MSQGVVAAAGRSGEPDTFQEGTEMLLLKHVLATAADGQPESVMAAIDKFGWDTRWVMCLGDVKGKFLDDAINSVQPCANILELGLYCGYSATRMARLLPPGGKVTTIEPSELHRSVASQVIAKAGLADKVDILPGNANEVIPSLAERGVTFDLVFIDHHKDSYLPDLQLLEQHGLLREGTVVVADNVVVFKLDAYLAHVRSSGKYSSSTLHMAHIEYSNDRPDGVEVSVYAG